MKRHVRGWLAISLGFVLLCAFGGLGASAGPQPSLTLSPNKTTFHVGDTITVSTTEAICQGFVTPGGQVRLVKGAADPVTGVPADLPVVLTVDGTTTAEGVLTATVRLPAAGTFQIEAKCADFPDFLSIVPTQITVVVAPTAPVAVPGNPSQTG